MDTRDDFNRNSGSGNLTESSSSNVFQPDPDNSRTTATGRTQHKASATLGKAHRTNIWLYSEDRDAIAYIQRRYGVSTDSDAVRLALRIFAWSKLGQCQSSSEQNGVNEDGKDQEEKLATW